MLYAISKINDKIRILHYSSTVCTLSFSDYAEEYEAEGTAYAIRDLLNSIQGEEILLKRITEARHIFHNPINKD